MRQSEQTKPVKVGACDSWWNFWCYSTDESDAVDDTKDATRDDIPVPPLPDLPDLTSQISLHSLKHKFEKDLGENIVLAPSSSQWGVIAILHSNSPVQKRAMVVQALFQAWKQGRFHQSYVSLYRTPLPGYDTKPWKMLMKARAIFPRDRYTVKDLLKPSYQQQASRDSLTLAQHQTVNLFFHRQLVTHVNNYAIQRLPSLDPQTIVDRIAPGYLLTNNQTGIKIIRAIMKDLFPLCHQVQELQDRLKDPFKMEPELLDELAIQTIAMQMKVYKMLRYMKMKITLPRYIDSIASYSLLKMTQTVLDFNTIVERINSPTLKRQIKTINQLQITIFRLAANALSDKIVDPRILNPRTQQDANPQIKSLLSLVKEQLQTLKVVWDRVKSCQPIAHKDVKELIQQTTQVVTEVNQMIQQTSLDKEKQVMELVLQAACQHLCLQHIMHQTRFSASLKVKRPATNFDRYAVKVQCKELVERGVVLLHQIKTDKICTPVLTDTEQSVMQQLHSIDRKLLATQNDHVTQPSKQTPWSGDYANLTQAMSTMTQCLAKLQTARGQLMKESFQPQPCLLTKLFDTTTTLQQKVGIFKRLLLAQSPRCPKLTSAYDRLDDKTMNYMLSLSPLFRNQVPSDQQQQDPIVYTDQSIVITETILKLSTVNDDQQQIRKDLRNFFIQRREPAIVQRVLQNSFQDCQTMLQTLSALTQEVRREMTSKQSSLETSVSTQYLTIATQLQSLYSYLQQKYKEYRSEVNMPEFMQKVEISRQQVTEMIKEANAIFSFPKTPATTPTPLYKQLNDFHSFTWNQETNDRDSYFLPAEDIDSYQSSSSSSSEETDRPIDSDSLPDLPPPLPTIEGVSIIANISFVTDQTSMAVQILGRKSLTQRLWEMAQFYPESRDVCVSRAVRDQVSDLPDIKRCTAQTEFRLNTYNFAQFAVQTQNGMPQLVESGVDMLLQKLHNAYYDRATVIEPQWSTQQSSLQAVLDFSQPMTSVDQFYMTPDETLIIESIPLPAWFDSVFPFQNMAPVPHVTDFKLSQRLMPSVCKVKTGTVMTNDGMIYSLPYYNKRKAPMPQCRSLLAMDCSELKSFAITARPPTGPTTSKAQIVEIYAEQHSVELHPKYLGDEVKIDGNATQVPYNQPAIFFKHIAYDKQAVAMVVSRTSQDGPIHVEYPLLGLSVYFDFDAVSMEMSAVHKYKLCGLCGNFDGQKTKELEGPTGRRKIMSSAQKFFQSYTIPDQQCQKAKNNLRSKKSKKTSLKKQLRNRRINRRA